MEPQKDIADQILEFLKKSDFGTSIKKISEELEYSRKTITKHLMNLKNEGEVFDREIGQYKVWIHKDVKEFHEKKNSMNDILLELYFSVIKTLEKNHKSIDGKMLGLQMTSEFAIEKFINEETFENIQKKIKKILLNTKKNKLEQITAEFLEVFKSLYLSNAKYDLDFIVNTKPLKVQINLRHEDFLNSPFYYDLLCGFMEGIINNIIKQIMIEKKILKPEISKFIKNFIPEGKEIKVNIGDIFPESGLVIVKITSE
ncbi:MAG: helix-turn-helix domain-containing protein [archaeon]|nr:helix-turn-helix domain-containing protein [archaeon]